MLDLSTISVQHLVQAIEDSWATNPGMRMFADGFRLKVEAAAEVC